MAVDMALRLDNADALPTYPPPQHQQKEFSKMNWRIDERPSSVPQI